MAKFNDMSEFHSVKVSLTENTLGCQCPPAMNASNRNFPAAMRRSLAWEAGIMSESNATSQDYESKRSQLLRENLELCDDFSKFSDEYSFLCDVFAAVAREPKCITPPTSEGIWHVSYRLKMQVRSYRDKINSIHDGLRALKRE